ncbi:MAG TPA: hypothetical protein VMU92_05940 [Acidobacteriaceae bacterium]|nr:hypothetical protein [Acidobacteriaceae bacterium]
MKLVGVLFVVLTAGVAMALTAAVSVQPQIVFSVANPSVEPAQYSLTIREDGTGVYKATYTPSGDDTAAAPVDRAIRVHNPVLAEIFSVARKSHFFAVNCQGHQRVAFTGKKTLTYSGPDGRGSCTFNYAHKKGVNNVAAKLMAVAYTLAIGSELQSEHRYDRLSLDVELAALQEAVVDKQALELENIASVLESISSDDAVMNQARARAQKLLHEASMTR